MPGMRRREFVTLLGGAAAAWPLTARAQQAERMRRIGVLTNLVADDPGIASPRRSVPAGAAGIRLDHRPQRADRHSLGGGRCRPNPPIRGGIGRARTGRHPDHGASARGAIAAGDPHACRSCLRRSPIRSAPASSNSLARPGGNATGFITFEYGLSGKWLELLKQIAPSVTRAAVLRDPAMSAGTGQFGVIQAVAPSVRVLK